MSGHSKWANIRVKKTAQDAKRGKVFTRHARLIEIAARAGGPDPSSNAALRTAIDSAREDNVPNMNIDRAIKKGSGEGKGEAMREMIFEAYGPGGTAYVVECLSDNRNRTSANVRVAIQKHGGRVADGGSVAWMFERKGLVIAGLPSSTAAAIHESPVLTTGSSPLQDIELELIDQGAEDFSVSETIIRVVTAINTWNKVRDFLKQKDCTILSAGLAFIPKQRVPVADEETAKKVHDFMEAIEQDDDVSEVHANAELP